jgi:hypothetical protein
MIVTIKIAPNYKPPPAQKRVKLGETDEEESKKPPKIELVEEVLDNSEYWVAGALYCRIMIPGLLVVKLFDCNLPAGGLVVFAYIMLREYTEVACDALFEKDVALKEELVGVIEKVQQARVTDLDVFLFLTNPLLFEYFRALGVSPWELCTSFRESFKAVCKVYYLKSRLVSMCKGKNYTTDEIMLKTAQLRNGHTDDHTLVAFITQCVIDVEQAWAKKMDEIELRLMRKQPAYRWWGGGAGAGYRALRYPCQLYHAKKPNSSSLERHFADVGNEVVGNKV